MPKKPSLVDEICQIERKPRTWFDQLSQKDQQTALEVREMVRSQGLAKEPVARNMIEKLGLKVRPQAVAKWFREDMPSD